MGPGQCCRVGWSVWGGFCQSLSWLPLSWLQKSPYDIIFLSHGFTVFLLGVTLTNCFLLFVFVFFFLINSHLKFQFQIGHVHPQAVIRLFSGHYNYWYRRRYSLWYRNNPGWFYLSRGQTGYATLAWSWERQFYHSQVKTSLGIYQDPAPGTSFWQMKMIVVLFSWSHTLYNPFLVWNLKNNTLMRPSSSAATCQLLLCCRAWEPG